MTTKFVSHNFRFGSGLYAEAGDIGVFNCVGVRVGALMLYPAGGLYIFVWGFFCGGGAVSSSSPPAGGGVGSYWASCGVTALPFFLGHLRFSAACHAAGYPSRVPHLADSGWLPYSCGGCLAWGWGCFGTDVLIPHLGFYLVTAQLPLLLLTLWGSAPLAGASACLSPVCWSTLGVELVGSLLRHLVFSRMPCSSSGPAACAAFPAAGYLGVFPVSGCLSFSFPGGVGWASVLPFFFWASPALLAYWGRWGFAPCVRVLQLRWCLLGLQVRSPCCPSFPLGWVCFWPAVSQAYVGCVGGLGCPSWFVDHVLWLLVGPGTCCFLEPSLGSSLSLPGWLLAWGGWGLSLVVLPL